MPVLPGTGNFTSLLRDKLFYRRTVEPTPKVGNFHLNRLNVF